MNETQARYCVICSKQQAPREEATIASNIRAFANESFWVWRCAACDCLHARDDVDLEHYYAQYPIHDVGLDFRTRPMYAKQLGRLRAGGLEREHSLLDYGCGSGAFIAFAKEAQAAQVLVGFDQYNENFRNPDVLNQTFDVVLCQDVIEHVPDPLALLDELGRLVKPNGILAIGTPNAARLELHSKHVHALHQPYHRHMFSRNAMRAAGESRGWQVIKHYSTMYINTPWPFINSRMASLVMRLRDNTMDAAMEPPSPWLLALLPWTLLVGFLGALVPPKTDMMTIFRVPHS